MRIHTCGEERAPVVIMLPGSFCNADTMMNIIMGLEAEFHMPRGGRFYKLSMYVYPPSPAARCTCPAARSCRSTNPSLGRRERPSVTTLL